MKKLLTLAALGLSLFAACNRGEQNKSGFESENDSLKQANGLLHMNVSTKDSALESFVKAFNDIQDNLDSVRKKQNLVRSSGTNSKDAVNLETQIKADVEMIGLFMERSKAKIQYLNTRLKTSEGTTKEQARLLQEFQRMVDRLSQEIVDKDIEMEDLRHEMSRMNVKIETLVDDVNKKSNEIMSKTQELNTGYFAIGTSSELKKAGVIGKEGGFIGIGQSTQLKKNFNRDFFSMIDITKTKRISINGRKVAVITNHPESSYKLVGKSNKIDYLEVSNPKEFWGASKYLVLVVKD